MNRGEVSKQRWKRFVSWTSPIVVFVLAIPLAAPVTSATTIDVFPGQSIQSAVSSANNGDTITVHTGTYEEVVTLNNGESNLHIIASPLRSAVVRGFRLRDCDAITVEGFEITPVTPGGVAKVYMKSENHSILNNYFHDTDDFAIDPEWRQRGPREHWCKNITVRGNLIRWCRNGIRVDGENMLIEGNEVDQLYNWSFNLNGVQRDADYIRSAGKNNVIRNNWFHGVPPIYVPDPAPFTGTAHSDGLQWWNHGNSDAYIENLLIEGNVFDGTVQGMLLQNRTASNEICKDITIRNNVYMYATASMLDLAAVKNVQIYNNVFYEARINGVRFLDGALDAGTTGFASRNIFHTFPSAAPYISNSAAQPAPGEDNVAWDVEGDEDEQSPPRWVLLDPQWVNPGAGESLEEVRESFRPQNQAVMDLNAGLDFDGTLSPPPPPPPPVPEPDPDPDPNPDPNPDPTDSLPQTMSSSNPSATVLVPDLKPEGQTAGPATMLVDVTDPDYPNELSITINGAYTVSAFGSEASSNHDNQRVVTHFDVPLEYLNTADGQTIELTWLTTQGCTIHGISFEFPDNDPDPGDTTLPVLTVIGDNPATVMQNTVYSDAGATATDNVDGNLTPSISVHNPVNTAVAGEYTVTYSVSDAAGNTASATRSVNVIASVPVTVYVDAAADPDSADGSSDRPFTMIAEAVALTVGGRGDLVLVGPGTYAEDISLEEDVSLAGNQGAYHTLIVGASSSSTSIVEMADGTTLRGLTIAGRSQGPAVGVVAGAIVEIDNCVLANSLMGLHVMDGASAAVANVTISGNQNQGVLAGSSAGLSPFINCIVSNNGTGVQADANVFGVNGYNNYFGNNDDLSGPSGASTDLAVDPIFVDTGNLNFHLAAQSACRDAGNPLATYNDVDGTTNDLGADGGPSGVQDVSAPFAVFGAVLSALVAPASAQFDASASADEWGIAEYAWDFDASDGIQLDATGFAPQYTYTANGVYLVTLTVTDNNGFSATTSQGVSLGSETPIVSAAANPEAGPAPLQVALTSSASDPDGGDVSLSWDFNDDGEEDSTDKNPVILFEKGTKRGKKKIRLTATDDEGESASVSVKVTVTGGKVAKSKEAVPGSDTLLVVDDPGSSLEGSSVSIPQGSLSDSTVITISEAEDMPELPDGFIAMSLMEIGPAGMMLSAPADVVMQSGGPKAAIGTSSVFLYDDKTGKWIDGPILEAEFTDASGQFLLLKTTQLGLLAVVESAAVQPEPEPEPEPNTVPGGGCNAGTLDTGSTPPPDDFLVMSLLVLLAAVAPRWIPSLQQTLCGQ